MPSIYQHEVVSQLRQIYGALLYEYHSLSITERLTSIANVLFEKHKAGHKTVAHEINNYHPRYLGWKPDSIMKMQFTLEDARQTIASEYGFGNWEDIRNPESPEDHQLFETAVDLLLNGELAQLTHMVDNHPQLIQQRSDYGHQATLLHYVGSNGVEFVRQRVPENLVDITRFLLLRGADVNAKMKVYGGYFSTYALLISSAHPVAAGILNEMTNLFDKPDPSFIQKMC